MPNQNISRLIRARKKKRRTKLSQNKQKHNTRRSNEFHI